MTKVLLSFKRLNDAGLLGFAEFIISSMTGNTNFLNPIPSLASLQTALDDYSTALNASQTGDKTAVAVKNDKRDILIAQLQQMAVYVTLTANSNRAMMISSGFEISKDSYSSIVLGVLANFKVENGINPGEMVSSANAPFGARSYQHNCSADPELKNESWIVKATTTSKATFTNLEPGKKYWFRMVAIGTNDQIVYSDIISSIAV